MSDKTPSVYATPAGYAPPALADLRLRMLELLLHPAREPKPVADVLSDVKALEEWVLSRRAVPGGEQPAVCIGDDGKVSVGQLSPS